MRIDRRGKFVSMVGYISKYLSYTQSCVGCIGRLVYSSKKTSLWGSPEYTEGSMRHWVTKGESKCYLYDIVNGKLVAVVEGVLSD